MAHRENPMARTTACCSKGVSTAGYAWVRSNVHTTKRFLVRFCHGCKTSHVSELIYVDTDLIFCLNCLSQAVTTIPDGMVVHVQCQDCGQATAMELDEPINPDVWEDSGESDDDLFS